MDQYPNIPIPKHITSHPLSLDDDLPIEFHLNDSIPEQYRYVFGESASEWNTKAELEMIRISDEIDHSAARNQEDSKNVIYWRSQYNVESITSPDGSTKTATETFIEVNHVISPDYYIPITDVDIIIYEEQNTVRGHTHWIFTSLLEAAGISPSEDMDVLDLQSLAVNKLSSMSSDDFYEMMIQWIKDSGTTFNPDLSREDIQSLILTEVNARVKDIEPLAYFEDLQPLIVKEYSFDLTTIFDNHGFLKTHILHEFGHAFGLRHNYTPNTLMYNSFNRIPIPKLPRQIVIPKPVDNLALYGLLCSYEELDHLKQPLMSIFQTQ